jgi:serine/threonine protein kinase
MCHADKHCSVWISLGILNIHGCLRDHKWLKSIVIPCFHTRDDMYIDLPHTKLRCIKNVAQGKFGYIDVAMYETDTEKKEVYVKRPIIISRAALYEALMQHIVREHLKAIGFPLGAPKVLQIFSLHDTSICFAMEQIENACTLDRFLDMQSPVQITPIIIDCLLQLLAMIWYLNSVLGVNHRDLKPSNFLITEHDTPQIKVLTIDNEIIEISSRYSLTLIDFGFACLGSINTHVADISLSTVYPKTDPCPKDGRDIYLFIGLLYIDFYKKLPNDICALFESWLDMGGINLCKFMCKDTIHYKKWLYFIAGNTEITHFQCTPLKILHDLQKISHK